MKKYNYLLLVILLLTACKNNIDTKFIEIEDNKKVDLQIKEKMFFYNTNSVTVGVIKDIEILRSKIVISDKANSSLIVFDKKMQFIKTSPGRGRGPGEFTIAPYISEHNDTLLVYEPGRGLQYIDSNFMRIKTISFPNGGYITDFSVQPVFLKSKIIISSMSGFPNFNKSISKITTALLINYNGEVIKGFCNFDKKYDRNLPANNGRIKTFVSKGFNNTIFILQGALTKIFQYDENGNYIASLNYKPRYYKESDLTKREISNGNRGEYYRKIILETSFYKDIRYCEKYNLLIVNYLNSHIERMISKSFTDTDSYIYIINNKYECIFDEKVEGYMVDIDNDYIYTLAEENINNIILNKYEIKFRD